MISVIEYDNDTWGRYWLELIGEDGELKQFSNYLIFININFNGSEYLDLPMYGGKIYVGKGYITQVMPFINQFNLILEEK